MLARSLEDCSKGPSHQHLMSRIAFRAECRSVTKRVASRAKGVGERIRAGRARCSRYLSRVARRCPIARLQLSSVVLQTMARHLRARRSPKRFEEGVTNGC